MPGNQFCASSHGTPPLRSAPSTSRHTVDAGGLEIAVWQTARAGPTVVFVHGFPDTHALWDAVVARLQDRFHCVTYDLRGFGASGTPARSSDYAVTHLLADLLAVIDDVAAGEPVHLVGHDWGSSVAWEAVVRETSDPRVRGRIASFTTISGPCLHHVRAFVASARHGGRQRRRQVAQQLLRSWYVYVFQLPWLPEYVLRHFHGVLPGGHGDQPPAGPTLADDMAHGVNLYRTNLRRPPVPVPGGAATRLPVQLVVPLRDRYVLPSTVADLPRFAPNLTRTEIDDGHWVPRSRPDELATAVAAFVTAHDGGPGGGV